MSKKSSPKQQLLDRNAGFASSSSTFQQQRSKTGLGVVGPASDVASGSGVQGASFTLKNASVSMLINDDQLDVSLGRSAAASTLAKNATAVP